VDKLKSIGRQSFASAQDVTQLTSTFYLIAQKINDQANSYTCSNTAHPAVVGSNHPADIGQGKGGEGQHSFSADGFTGGCNLK